ncbi:MAG: hypothetical protein L3K06_03665 [Thermoplasmata archaeon]|nr:hypothetical protein [Thermoplasmata archaeon]MCI4354443.1 hypothetical protein [Thermoplasmata archaeon]
MRLFAGRSARDREHLAQTLRSLGATSVAGLSAALSWSERRTERAIQDALRRGYGAIRFDPERRSVAWNSPAAPPPPADAPAAVAPTLPAAAPEPPTLPKSWGASAKCPNCSVPFLPTGTPGHSYCPQCGRLTTVRGVGPSRAAAPEATAAATAAPNAPGRGPSLALGPDRRSQELFAAWVTAQPIPCPKCRTPLRHHGVAEYACPSCGARVAFERSATLPPSARAVAPEAPPPATGDLAPSAL